VDLWLSKNKFNGDISPLADLGIIETIHIFENDFAGTIPNMFDEIFHLRDFLAQDNKFSGEIPRTITHMQAISKLWNYRRCRWTLFGSSGSSPIDSSFQEPSISRTTLWMALFLLDLVC
jgi:cell wall assembly regulator SMI1